ncbi:DUF1549 and DUF1553 domain-containing protein [Verrucomicrobia bacterium]|nr:DUF1549 and DUF1553 domain-containing protein [Verrucomicrobiota bacterium]
MTRLTFISLWLLTTVSLVLFWLYQDKPYPPSAPKFENTTNTGKTHDKQSTSSLTQSLERNLIQNRASDLEILRRLSMALTGTIPSVEWIRDYEAWPEDQRISLALERIFGDRRSSDYLAERFARAFVGVENGPFLVYRRRRMVDDLSEMIHANRPYDQIVKKLITAKGIWTSKPEVNFLTATIDPNNDKEGPDEIKLAARVSRAFLGIRIDCVQCHNDMFGDRWKQKDFHQMASFFSGAEMSLTGLIESEKPYKYRYKRQPAPALVPPQVPFNESLLPAEGSLRERLAAWVTHPENKPFARALVNRVWAMMFNKPLVNPVDSIPVEGPFPEALESLANEAIASGFDLRHLITMIANSSRFQITSRTLDQSETPPFPMTRLRPEQVAGSIIQSASLETVDADSHILSRVIRILQQSEFIKRYGDAGEDEFVGTGGTIPQRLTVMNGKLVEERTEENLVMNAATRIGALAPNDSVAVEMAYLATLTRRPTESETQYFTNRFRGKKKKKRATEMQDLFWSLINSTEFAWNH